MGNYLAFDMGAESSRAVLGTLDDNNKLQIKLLHRSPNGMINLRGTLHWDIVGMYREVLNGISSCVSQCGDKVESIGVDTWGVDFGLFDSRGSLIGEPVAYRDSRRIKAMVEFLKIMPREKLYKLTAIQINYVNTLFELYAMTRENNPQLSIAKDLLFIPDIFNYFLTGMKATEFSFATTTQLYNIRTNSWEKEIFNTLDLDISMMQKIIKHGTVIGTVESEIYKQTGLKEIPVVAVGSHDTASAVAACPLSGDSAAYISSGTWSLMGIESKTPIISETAFKYNFTNEGGVCDTYRVLKNITGLWLLQEYRREEAKVQEYSYAELSNMGASTTPFGSVIDPDAPEFVKPESMSQAISGYCKANGQLAPQTVGEYVRLILQSLALTYRFTITQIEKISGRKITQINVIGGGSQNPTLNQFTADATGLPVYAGPVEATAIGNLLIQAIAMGSVRTHAELRDIVRRSFPLTVYEPRSKGNWDELFARFLRLKGLA